jgi:hypothetical protein
MTGMFRALLALLGEYVERVEENIEALELSQPLTLIEPENQTLWVDPRPAAEATRRLGDRLEV